MQKQTLVELFYLAVIIITGFLMLSQTSGLKIFDAVAEQQMRDFLTADITNRIILEGKSVETAKETAEKTVAELLEKEQVKERIKASAEALKELHKDETGQVYPFRVDSYLFIRKAKSYLEHGGWGVEKTENGWFSVIDPLRYYPFYSTPSEFDIVSYLFAVSYKMLNIFHSVDILTVVFYLPLIFGILSLIIVYFTARIITGRAYLAFISAFFVSLNHRFFVGTFAGNADSQFLFSFIIVLVVFLYLHMIDSLKKFMVLIIPFGLLFYLLQISWSGWIYPAGVIFPHAFICVFYSLYKRFNMNKKTFFILFILALFFSIIVVKPQNYFERMKYYLFKSEKLELLELKLISETKPYSFQEFLYAIGGYEKIPVRGFLIFLFTIISVILISHKNIRSSDKYQLFLILWFLLSLFMALKAKRFSLYMAPSHGILVGLGLSLVAEKLSPVKKYLLQKKILNYSAMIFIPLLILVASAKMIEQAKEFIPEMNDAVMNAGEFIKETTAEDTPIITWWDKGYLWQFASERPTISDGASGGTDYQRNFILANAFLSSNDNVSTSLFNILSCREMGSVLDLIKYQSSLVGYPARYRFQTLLKQKNIFIRYHDLLKSGVYFMLEEYCPEKNYTVAVSEDMLYKINAFSSLIKWDVYLGIVQNLLIKKNMTDKWPKSFRKDQLLPKNMTEKEILKKYYDIITETEAQELLSRMEVHGRELKNVQVSDLFECEYKGKYKDVYALCADIVKINSKGFLGLIDTAGASLPKNIIFMKNTLVEFPINNSHLNKSLVVFSLKTFNNNSLDGNSFYYFFIDDDYSKTNFAELIRTAYADEIMEKKETFFSVADLKNKNEVVYKLGSFVNVVSINFWSKKSRYAVDQLLNNTQETVLRRYYDVLSEEEFEELIFEIKRFDKEIETPVISKILDCQGDGGFANSPEASFSKTGGAEILCNSIKIDAGAVDIKGPVRPKNLVFVKLGKLIEKNYDTYLINNSMVVFEAGGKYSYFFIDPKYGKSMLVKLIAGAEIEGLKKVYSADEPEIVNVYAGEKRKYEINEVY